METYLTQQFRVALARLVAGRSGLPDDFDPETVEVEWQVPANPEHGDLATNLAMQLASVLRAAPRRIAEELADTIDLDPKRVAATEVAGPGFINLRFAASYLAESLREILDAGTSYGRSDDGAGQAALVEYVSANPTGPLTVGHGRNAVLGDTVANLLEATGYAVTREYYFNDAGRQMRVLGESVRARYEAHIGETRGEPVATKRIEVAEGETIEVPERFPDDGYLGGYVDDIAKELADEHGEALLEADGVQPFTEAAQSAIFADIEATLGRLGIKMDAYFNERALYDSEAVWQVVEALREKGLAYDEDGAIWFATGKLGKKVDGEPKDVVLVKSSGEPTYRLPDIAYHLDKLSRPVEVASGETKPGFDRVVDVFGADHVATYPDVIRGVEALGGDGSKISVLVYQFVTLVRGGEPVKMSTRKANYVTLDELMDEVTPDVTRFFFLMRAPGTHLDFDLDLAKETSDKNPVFYLQYAHARICSIQRKAEEVGLSFTGGEDLSLLMHEAEEALIKRLLQFPDEVRAAAKHMAPHKLTTALREVATDFNQFYRDCRILGEEEDLGMARLALAEAARQVLETGLTLLGIEAPARM